MVKMKERVIIERLETSNQGTFGRITFGDQVLFTGELPWRNNASDISCITEGLYQCRWTYSDHFKQGMYLIEGVEKREGIRIHPANLMGDKSKGFQMQLNGCIALGEKLGSIDGQKALLLSAPAVRKFESYMNKKPFILEIKYA
jgi:hypothetical protein